MNFIGDYFALGLVTILCMFFFDSRISVRHMPKASKLFVACLLTTALTAFTDLITGQMLAMERVPLWQNMTLAVLLMALGNMCIGFADDMTKIRGGKNAEPLHRVQF